MLTPAQPSPGRSGGPEARPPAGIIQIESLVKHYGPIKAVDGISFQVQPGEVFAMLGPNGAGKTTTLEIIEGLRTADSGSVRVLGLDVTRGAGRIKQRIGIQLQAPSMFPLLNLEETLTTFAGLYQRHLPVPYVMELLALQESRKTLVKHLSGGQQQRLSVAMALINDPEIAFLDEPTTGLDPQARRSLWGVIADTKKKGKTILLTTHYMEEAERLCDRVAIVDHGKIIALGSPQELVKAHFEERAIQFTQDEPPSPDALARLPGASRAAVDGNDVVIYSRDIPATMSALLEPGRHNGLADLYVRQATLEDVFLKLTGRKIRE